MPARRGWSGDDDAESTHAGVRRPRWDVRRGLLRLWLVTSGLWAAAVIGLGIASLPAPWARAPPDCTLTAPEIAALAAAAREGRLMDRHGSLHVKFPGDWPRTPVEAAHPPAWPAGAALRASEASCIYTDDDLRRVGADYLRPSTEHARRQAPWWNFILPVAVVPPLAILALGMLAVWIGRGFRSSALR